MKEFKLIEKLAGDSNLGNHTKAFEIQYVTKVELD